MNEDYSCGLEEISAEEMTFYATSEILKRLREGKDLRPSWQRTLSRQTSREHWLYCRWQWNMRWHFRIESIKRRFFVSPLQKLGILPPSRTMRGEQYGWWGICETAWNVAPGHGWDRIYTEPADVPEEELYCSSNQVAVYGPFATESEAFDAANPGNIYLEEEDDCFV